MNQPLFAEFPPITPQDWEAQIAADLKGKTVDDLSTTIDDLTVKPFYMPNGQEGTTIKTQPGWIICAEIEALDGKEANAACHKAIENGAGGLRLRVDRLTDIHALLEDLPLEKIQIDFLTDRRCWNVLDDIRMIPKTHGIRGAIDYDLMAEDRDDTPQLFDEYALLLPNFRLITVHAAEDLTPAEALADMLKRGNRYIKGLLDVGYTIDTIAAKIQFTCQVGIDYFMEIAKLRALRSLWLVMLHEYGAANPPIFIHADNLPIAPTEAKDAYYNMIRHTTQAMAAIIGGADSVCVTASGDEEKIDFLQHIALNTQLVLKHEAKLDKVADPGAGSWYLESLTNQLAEKAWELFLKE